MTREAVQIGGGAIVLLAALCQIIWAMLMWRGVVPARKRFGLPASMRAGLLEGIGLALLGIGPLLTAWTGQSWWSTGLLFASVPFGFANRVLDHELPEIEGQHREAATRRRVLGAIPRPPISHTGRLSLAARRRRF